MRYLLLCAVILHIAFAVADAETVVLQPGPDIGNDTYISSGSPNTNFGNQDEMYVSDFAGTILQSLIQFIELDDYIGRTVSLATFSLYFKVTFLITGADLYMAKITESWDEDVVTWNTCPDYESTYYTFNYPTSTERVWVDYDVTEIVSDWLGGISDSYGLILYTDDNRRHEANADTSNYSEPTYRPKLTLEFITAVESSSLGQLKAAFR